MNNLKLLKKIQFKWPKKKKLPIKKAGYIFVGVLIVVVGILLVYSTMNKARQSEWHDVTNNYYDPIDLVLYDPDIQLVDIRSANNYKEGHIKKAINIPVDFEDGEMNNADRVVQQFSELGDKSEIVIYGENNYTLRTLRVALLLEENNINVKILRVGWTEFFHFQTFWLPEEISSKVNILNYIELPE